MCATEHTGRPQGPTLHRRRGSHAQEPAEGITVKAGALQRAIFNSANFSSIATDARGVIQIFNVGAERMLGYTADEVINRISSADISDPDEIIARARALSLELKTEIQPGFEALVYKASRGIEDIYELTYVRKDGTRLPALVSVTALRDTEDDIIGYLLIGTDNTARKAVESERALLNQTLQEKNHELQAAKSVAEKANLAKSEFLSSMSHELRTPLSAILGFAQLIESGSPPPTPEQRRSVDQILKAGWYLLDLINEILDLALVESGRLSLSLETIGLAELMHECECMIELQARKQGISVTFPGLEARGFVRADRTRLKQVLINLLSNAVKYNRPGGTVTVTYAASGPGRLRVCVEDTGRGLSAEQMVQLFQPFNRLGQEAQAEEGTGIGLVVSKRLVELMGGAIGALSTAGKGSLFWIELDATPAAAGAPRLSDPGLTAAAPSSRERDTLLYVEDNPANLMLVQDLMARRPDIRLLTATDGRMGVEMARAALPDVVLMDINLPGLNGIQALRLLAEDPLTALIPVVALSANAMPRDIAKGLAAGFFRYLTKPIRLPEFTEALDVALAASKARRAHALAKETP